MVSIILLVFLIAYILLIVAVPTWIIMGIIWLIKRNNPSRGLSKALKIVSIVILVNLPVWIFLFVIAGSAMTLM